MTIKLDGREVKVGDRLWSYLDGWITVTDLRSGTLYPIESNTDTYTSDGKLYESNRGRVLFWDEVKIDPPPPPPKRKVRKYQWVVRGEIYEGFVSTHYTEHAARKMFGDRVIRPIEETMIEVEE